MARSLSLRARRSNPAGVRQGGLLRRFAPRNDGGSMRPNLYAFLAGLAAACAFQPLALWPLMVLALACFIRLVGDAPGLRAALALGWWFGLGQFVLGLNWIATAFTYQAAMPAWLGWLAVVLLSLYLALYPAVAAGLA